MVRETNRQLPYKRIIFGSLLFGLVTYYYVYNKYFLILSRRHLLKPVFNFKVNDSYLIQTEGCTIPNYAKTFHYKESGKRADCDTRAIFIHKTSDSEIMFVIDDAHFKHDPDYTCCYQFLIRSTKAGFEDTRLMNYLKCTDFQNGTTTQLLRELITVTCSSKKNKKKTIYKDSYMIVKKKNGTENIKKAKNKWNILLIGMDTMSRTRVYDTMPKTTNYLGEHGWLDFRGYHKVGYNTYPNLMALLTGLTDVYANSAKEQIIWNTFQSHGYRTAYGEDELNCPDTFRNYGGFKRKPTDHYMRPLFLTGETSVHNLIVCTGKLSSGEQLLDYAFDFANTYKDSNPFFGMFWMNSFSHDIDRKQSQIDEHVKNLFVKMNDSGILENTFVMFFSDHGIRFGKQRFLIESYYDERLPMLFVHVPQIFKELYPTRFTNALINQHRLVSTYDLHATLLEILRLSEENSNEVPSSVCVPHCINIFTEHPTTRTCADAFINDKWCGCHELTEALQTQHDVNKSISVMEKYVRNHVVSIPTKGCKKCDAVKLKSILRVHSYTNLDKKYYVIALMVTNTNLYYEGVVASGADEFKVEGGVDVITGWTTRGTCTKKYYHQGECKCIVDKQCNKTKKDKT